MKRLARPFEFDIKISVEVTWQISYTLEFLKNAKQEARSEASRRIIKNFDCDAKLSFASLRHF
jgi:hypothetical protein